ncbi:MAG: ABC-F family ATP-binding cassette domain-containing protein [Candidatus Eisenbacteria bacterium]|uniref:ABC-F family ATP-binding cassette domain-containing protein n=1 Tax=Eiseniibacteriota bacterium TaxID=2212470 RepID=A0A956LZL2_UNCEI|nr:ABC-F family ATP-binding cassette domain-containing protein [Candidatus Eisenbacteria bacterium]
MLKALGIDRAFGGQVLFDHVDWVLGDRDRVGLVGPNGSGKSTWLRMLAGEESPDAGSIETPRSYRVGYLPQFAFELGHGTVRDEARSAFAAVLAIKEELEGLEARLETPLAESETEALLARHTRLEEEFRHRDGYEIDRQVDRVLRGLGFTLSDFGRSVDTLSGGWQMRVAPAKLLLERPDALLLDEPTNHLDLEAREWLEGFLRDYPGAFVVVSHDRYFLDQTVNRITDLMTRQLVDYSGTYSQYLEQRQKRYEMAMTAWKRQQDEIKRIERFIERFKAKNTKATQAQSRVKMLERMERLEKPEEPSRTVHFQFPQPDRSGRITLEVEGIHKSYGPIEVFRGIDLAVERGQKVALVGPNGAGKSTLMRILAGQEPIELGTRTVGLKVTLDFFAQDAADRMPRDKTILEEAMTRAPTDFVPRVRGLLGAFLFSGPAVDKPIGVLSGGERNRLALAMMLMRPSNVLLLDEPTNHLDMTSKDVLLEALRQFEGTVVFVSHDRFFLEQLATRVIEVGGGTIYDYPGGYEGFLHQKGLREEGEAVAPVSQRTAAALPSEAPVRRKPNQRKLEALEQKIAQLEERKAKLETLLADGEIYRDSEKAAFYTNEYESVAAELENAVESWAVMSEE